MFKLFKKRKPAPIKDVALKRKALELYCKGREWLGAACRGAFVGMAACPLYYRIPWGDNCHDTDEEVAMSYWLLYGDEDPREILEVEND